MTRLARIVPASMCISLTLAGSAAADCTCRARGVVAKHGETLCIPTPNGARLARCDKVSNVASWTFLPAPCPLTARTWEPSVAESGPAVDQSRPERGAGYWLALSD